MDHEVTPYEKEHEEPSSKEILREESQEQESQEREVTPQKKEIDTFIQILLYLFSFFMGPFGLGAVIGTILFVQREREFREVGRICLILSIFPTLLLFSLAILFFSLAIMVSIGSFFF